MKIHRALLLAATLAPAGCYFHWGTGTEPKPRVTATPRPTPPAPVASKPPAPAPAPASPPDVAALLKGNWRPQIVIHRPQPAAPAPAPGTPPCLSLTAPATVPPCAPHPDLQCGPGVPQCQAFATMMVPAVAAAAVACTNKLTGAQRCDPVQTSACEHGALAQACPDPDTLAPLCQIAAPRCKSSESDCVLLLSGLTPDAQDAVARCVGAGCASGLYACVEGLASPK